MKKIIFKITIPIAFLVLLIIPIFIMIQLSQAETSKYIEYTNYNFKEVSYGKPTELIRTTVKDYFIVNGTATSNISENITFKESYEKINVLVQPGDEIHSGDVLAYCDNDTITSNRNALVEEVIDQPGGYIKITTFMDLKLSTFNDEDTIKKIQESSSLLDENGNKIDVVSISNMITEGKREVIFSVKNNDFKYGLEVNNFKIYTGKTYENALVIDKDCVYQKKENGPYYVRVVDEEWNFISETEVNIGFETEEVVSVTNLDENTFCDSGYKDIIDYSADTNNEDEFPGGEDFL